MATFRRSKAAVLLVTCSLLGLSACSDGFDVDMRDISGTDFDTTDATRLATEPRPDPDDRGVITYPNFQVALARNGDTVGDVATRLGLNPEELARYNGINPDAPLRQGEVVALPRTVGATPGNGDTTDIAALATGALDRADASAPPRSRNVTTTTLSPPPAAARPTPAPEVESGPEPVRHRVKRGETAYSISRLYRVSVRALADWNGLGPNMTVREGQVLLIPVASAEQPKDPTRDVNLTTVPGSGTPTPEPPSASQPLPEELDIASAEAPPSPKLAEDRSEASNSRLLMPVSGSIVRPYSKGKNDGIDISASAGTKVKAAESGTVAAITRDTDEVPILVIRHDNDILTVYANIHNIAVNKGDRVTRGQTVAEVRDSAPAFLHFEVREGFDSVDPVPYVN